MSHHAKRLPSIATVERIAVRGEGVRASPGAERVATKLTFHAFEACLPWWTRQINVRKASLAAEAGIRRALHTPRPGRRHVVTLTALRAPEVLVADDEPAAAVVEADQILERIGGVLARRARRAVAPTRPRRAGLILTTRLVTAAAVVRIGLRVDACSRAAGVAIRAVAVAAAVGPQEIALVLGVPVLPSPLANADPVPGLCFRVVVADVDLARFGGLDPPGAVASAMPPSGSCLAQTKAGHPGQHPQRATPGGARGEEATEAIEPFFVHAGSLLSTELRRCRPHGHDRLHELRQPGGSPPSAENPISRSLRCMQAIATLTTTLARVYP
jgi:hypothetical protein